MLIMVQHDTGIIINYYIYYKVHNFIFLTCLQMIYILFATVRSCTVNVVNTDCKVIINTLWQS